MALFSSHFKMPALLGAILLFSLTLGNLVPVEIKSSLYAISLSIKEALVFVLPFLIFSFLFSSMSTLKKESILFVLLLLPIVCLSNFLSVFLAYSVSALVLTKSTLISVAQESAATLEPLWDLKLPKLISNDYALFSGFGLGILFSLRFPSQSATLSNKLLKFTYFILKKLFVPIMPLFILGFLLKLQHEQVLITICKDYFFVFLIITLAISSYLLFAYGALNGFQKKPWAKSLKNMTPAMMTGFSTMSSAAAMPFTIIAAEQNVSRPEMARALIPSTVNIHMIGDSFSIIIFAMTILVSFGNEFLPIGQFFIFGFYYVISRFAGAGVPGGGVLIVLPVLEQQLGFSPAMLSLITALYIIFDPIITSGNVMGNGAFAIAFSKFYQVVEKRFSFSILQTHDPNKPKTASNKS
jgi:hypothetical protein